MLLIFMTTVYTIGSEMKTNTQKEWMSMADNSITVALTGKLLPQTLIWFAIAMLMEAWLFGFNGFPLNGSTLWMTLNTLMLVLASQGFALFVFCLLPNLRFSVSICSLTGILTFSLAAYSFPVESMYGGVAVFSWMMPVRYYFLIYIDQALNGIDIWYSRWYFVAYFIYFFAPLLLLWRVKKAFNNPVQVP